MAVWIYVERMLPRSSHGISGLVDVAAQPAHRASVGPLPRSTGSPMPLSMTATSTVQQNVKLLPPVATELESSPPLTFDGSLPSPSFVSLADPGPGWGVAEDQPGTPSPPSINLPQTPSRSTNSVTEASDAIPNLLISPPEVVEGADPSPDHHTLPVLALQSTAASDLAPAVVVWHSTPTKQFMAIPLAQWLAVPPQPVLVFDFENLIDQLPLATTALLTNVKQVYDLAVAAFLLDSAVPPKVDQVCQLYLPDRAPSASWPSLLNMLWRRLKAELEQRQQLTLFERLEVPLTPVLVRMQVLGVGVALPQLVATQAALQHCLQSLTQEAAILAGQSFNLDSAQQVANILFTHLQLGRNVPMLPMTASGKPSTGEETLRKLQSKHPLPGLILRYRQLKRCLSGYIEQVCPLVHEGTVHPRWHQPGLRERGKRVTYAVVYGVGAERLAAQLQLSVPETGQLVAEFLDRFPGVAQLRDRVDAYLHQHGYVETLTMRRRYLSPPGTGGESSTTQARDSRAAFNFVMQGSAADICKAAMVTLQAHLDKHEVEGGIVLQLHDQIVIGPSLAVKTIRPYHPDNPSNRSADNYVACSGSEVAQERELDMIEFMQTPAFREPLGSLRVPLDVRITTGLTLADV
ncbi:uncharacterized protein MONBRDRAFT_5161 [Monosiga brevicollis MX1]|uniref:DNA-directed DNA polymerase n=1 Tax=Monosiga brevicollis TaxID=81824 RepID=A9UQ37_MONBE|nr:uncharacterized protein MONBRDRAFT_5161 [Monosiga brevicollis MX1]EDQ92978.1 predicted protein [Monosiga brevicollis MX1]|eukprot:XP_001742740.1 hypothetical protein [Monosiga brevicollis MX1]